MVVVRSSASSRILPLRGALSSLRLLPGVAVVAMFVVWAVHDGGYDNDTWYWGALLTLAMLLATVLARRGTIRMARDARLALGLFALYVAWSYLSITWASAQGVALQGSNRALLYLLLYALMLILPWGRRGARSALGIWVLGIGVLAVALLVRLGSQDDVGSLLFGGRLAAPTGYINASAALFFMGALSAIAFAAARGLPGPVRGLALALACAELQLVLIVESRGWLFTLPIVLVAAVVIIPDRLRSLTFAALPVLGVTVILRRLLDVYSASGAHIGPSAARAAQAGLVVCFVVFVAGTVLAWIDWLLRERSLSAGRRRVLGVVVAVLALAGAAGGTVAATHGHPVRFIVRQWNGFSHPEKSKNHGTHFLDVGSGRYDFWRVSLDAFLANPVGGLGQDNFDDYYIVRGRSGEEPSWTHSLEMRLLAHTGAVGFLLFAGFIIAALRLALRARRRAGPAVRPLVAIALLPFVVWLIHGSVDWFWEMPALSGPALAFLGMACSIAGSEAGLETELTPSRSPSKSRSRFWSTVAGRRLAAGGGMVLVIAATLTLGLPYLATRLMSIAADTATTNPAAALTDLSRAAALDPLNSDPTRTAGEIALQTGRYRLAATRFRQTLAREPGDWFAYLGSGLAASALGDPTDARRDFTAAYHINRNQSANRIALQQVQTRRPLTYDQVLNLISADN